MPWVYLYLCKYNIYVYTNVCRICVGLFAAVAPCITCTYGSNIRAFFNF